MTESQRPGRGRISLWSHVFGLIVEGCRPPLRWLLTLPCGSFTFCQSAEVWFAREPTRSRPVLRGTIANYARYPVATMCRVLQVSACSQYAHRTWASPLRSHADMVLMERTHRIHLVCGGPVERAASKRDCGIEGTMWTAIGSPA